MAHMILKIDHLKLLKFKLWADSINIVIRSHQNQIRFTLLRIIHLLLHFDRECKIQLTFTQCLVVVSVTNFSMIVKHNEQTTQSILLT